MAFLKKPFHNSLQTLILAPFCHWSSRESGREREGRNASFPPCRQGGFNPCRSTKAKGPNLVPHLARLDMIEYVLEMVTNSSIRRVQAFQIGLQEGRTRHRRSIRRIQLGRGPLHTYCNMEDIFIVRTRVLFFKALIRGQCHVF